MFLVDWMLQLKIALDKTGLTNREYEIIEMPEREWFDLNSFLAKLFTN